MPPQEASAEIRIEPPPPPSIEEEKERNEEKIETASLKQTRSEKNKDKLSLDPDDETNYTNPLGEFKPTNVHTKVCCMRITLGFVFDSLCVCCVCVCVCDFFEI